MKVFLGKAGLRESYQENFSDAVGCPLCDGDARIAFVACETTGQGEKHICDLHKNDPDGKGYWPHDVCAIAVYFCKKCFTPIAEYNQA